MKQELKAVVSEEFTTRAMKVFKKMDSLEFRINQRAQSVDDISVLCIKHLSLPKRKLCEEKRFRDEFQPVKRQLLAGHKE